MQARYAKYLALVQIQRSAHFINEEQTSEICLLFKIQYYKYYHAYYWSEKFKRVFNNTATRDIVNVKEIVKTEKRLGTVKYSRCDRNNATVRITDADVLRNVHRGNFWSIEHKGEESNNQLARERVKNVKFNLVEGFCKIMSYDLNTNYILLLETLHDVLVGSIGSNKLEETDSSKRSYQ